MSWDLLGGRRLTGVAKPGLTFCQIVDHRPPEGLGGAREQSVGEDQASRPSLSLSCPPFHPLSIWVSNSHSKTENGVRKALVREALGHEDTHSRQQLVVSPAVP